MFKKVVYIMSLISLSGCLLILDDDCERDDPDYWYTEHDCYDHRVRVRVCNEYNVCWYEDRYNRVCDDYHVCRDNEDWRR